MRIGILDASDLDWILGNQATIQALVVATLGSVAWLFLGHVRSRVRTADNLLASFGSSIPRIDWPTVGLTRRELTVLALLRVGILRDADIADRLSISPETVRSHVKSIMAKTGLHSRIELSLAVNRDDAVALSSSFSGEVPRGGQ